MPVSALAIGRVCPRAVAANLTIVNPSSQGHLTATAQGVVVGTSNLNFAAGDVRAVNAILSLTGNPLGAVGVTLAGSGQAHFLLDVTGYFE